jgi:hypothetical protein
LHVIFNHSENNDPLIIVFIGVDYEVYPMLNEHLDSRFLFPTPLLPLGDFLMKFSEQSLFAVAVRSIENGRRIRDMKIIMHNKPSGDIRGFKEGAQVGMTFPEVLAGVPMDEKMKEAEMQKVEENDQNATQNNTQSTHNQVTLDYHGFVRVFQRIVTPLAGYHGKMIALSTISLELTQYINLLHLFTLYQLYYQHHENKELQSIAKFSEYLKLDHYFTSALKLGEITTLLAMATDNRHKKAALLITTFLKKPCTAKTIATYTSLIREKLKPGVDMYMVLRSLRDAYQLQHLLFKSV